MKSLKVMLVDDEILAVEDIKEMIDWKTHGFEIVAATTSSREAVMLLDKYNPDLIFADINMPSIDGLELSKIAIERNPFVKIIILTAYKDFEYAKTSVEIGVTSYLLKHEINEQRLILELDKVKEQIIKEHRKNKIIRKQLLAQFLRGESVAEELIKYNIAINLREQIIIPMIIKLDEPFVFYDGNNEEQKINMDFDLRDYCYLDKNIMSIDVLNIGKNKAFIIIALRKMHSQKEIDEITLRIADILQKEYRNLETENGFSVCIGQIVNGLNELPNSYLTVLKSSDYSVFLGREKIFRTRDLKISKDYDIEYLEDEFKKLETYLNEFNIEKAEKVIEALFESVCRHFYSLYGLKELCGRLYKFFIKFSKEKNLDLEYNYKSKILELYDVNSIEAYFKKELKNIVERAQRYNNSKYSKKVQQIISFIQNNYSEDITIEQVAREMNISSVYLSQIFKKETGQTFLEFFTSYRIEVAKNLIGSGKYKVYEVANMVGYKTSQYFSQVFRKITGCNPLDYKQGGN